MSVDRETSSDTRLRARRRARLSLLGATGAVAIGLLAASAALACTVGVHGGLVITQPAGEADSDDENDIELFATLTETVGKAPYEEDGSGGQEDYPVVMDPDQVSTSVPPSATPSECFGQDEHDYTSSAIEMTGDNDTNDHNNDGDLDDPDDDPGGDDVLVGEMFYGSEEVFSQASQSDPLNNPRDEDAFLYGHGGFDVPDWPSGTYEVCAQPEYKNNWDHFRIL